MKTISRKVSALSKEKLLMQLFQSVRSEKELSDLFDALFTPPEKEMLAERSDIIRGILTGKTQRKISEDTGASLATVSRGSREVKFGSGIFLKLFQRII